MFFSVPLDMMTFFLKNVLQILVLIYVHSSFAWDDALSLIGWDNVLRTQMALNLLLSKTF